MTTLTPFERRFDVRTHECGTDGLVSLSGIVNYFQEAATLHATQLGVGMNELMDRNLAWVLTRIALQVSEYPGPDTPVTVRTWPTHHDKKLAYRSLVLLGQDGQEYCRAITAWAMIDIVERRMASMDAWFHDSIPSYPESCMNFISRSVPRLRNPEGGIQIISRRSDLDVNGHVNNSHFVEWALESVESDYVHNHFLEQIDVSFRLECREHEEVRSFCEETDDTGTFLHSLNRAHDGKEMVRARSTWRPVDQ